MKIFVTGASGFIGRRLVERVVAEGDEVTALVRHGSRLLPKTVHTVEGDVTAVESFRSALQGCERLYHLAAQVAFDPRMRVSLFRVNAAGTENVLRAAIRSGVGRVVVVGSACTLGVSTSATLVLNEDSFADEVLAANSPYLASKAAAEQIALRAVPELDVVIVNPTTVYGAGDWSLNSGTLIAQVAKSRIMPVPPGGSNVVDVNDVVDGVLAAGKRGISGRRYVLGGENLLFQDLFDVVADVVGHKPFFVPIPRWMREPLALAASLAGRVMGNRFLTRQLVRDLFKYKFYSNERARTELGWKPKRDFRQSVTDAWGFYRREGLITCHARSTS